MADLFWVKVAGIWPEIILGIGATACLLMGASVSPLVRRSTAWVAAISLGVALLVLVSSGGGDATGLAALGGYVKAAALVIGLLLLVLLGPTPEDWSQTRLADEAGPRFDPGSLARGEFHAFFLLSLAGVMLCAGASDLVWLFLALELTSLPSYVMIAISRDRRVAQEAAIKYFFLGALSAAIFLYGFTLIYGATGFTTFVVTNAAGEVVGGIAPTIAEQGMTPLLTIGFVLAIIGIGFKIAAFPMHFYAADVYDGAHISVSAMLAFVPKTAGFVALMVLLSQLPQPLPAPISWTLWIMAAVSMTVGNVLGLQQERIKRVLAYSSIAQSGYMILGLMAGASVASELANGYAAVLFYLVAYGLASTAMFAAVAALNRDGDEIETYGDLSGLYRTSPFLASVIVLSALSLIGLPPMIGFLGKIYLFGPLITESGEAGRSAYTWLVVIAVINSAISAVYYLRFAAVAFFGSPAPNTEVPFSFGKRFVGFAAGLSALLLGVFGAPLTEAAHDATLAMSRPAVLGATPDAEPEPGPDATSPEPEPAEPGEIEPPADTETADAGEVAPPPHAEPG